LYEYVYFSNKKNVFGGQVVGDVRRRLGAELAHEQPAPAGAIVLGVPNSGLPASEGYADALGLEKVNAIEKNKNAIRTFIIPTQAAREEAAMQKYIIDEEAVADKIVVVVDDSLIRSTTARALSKQLRGAGALEVHFRIPAPPYRYSCTYGMDTGDASELLAAKMSVDDMPAELGVDSVAFLSVEAAYRASVRSVGQMCTACCTGIYPTPVPVGIRQQALART
jgi:amidophosphoribosyltransferase